MKNFPVTRSHKVSKAAQQYDAHVLKDSQWRISTFECAVFAARVWLGRTMRVVSLRYIYSQPTRGNRGPIICFDTMKYGARKGEGWVIQKSTTFKIHIDAVENLTRLVKETHKFLKRDIQPTRLQQLSRLPVAQFEYDYKNISFDLAWRTSDRNAGGHWHLLFRTWNDHRDDWHLLLPLADNDKGKNSYLCKRRIYVYLGALLRGIRIARHLKKRWAETPHYKLRAHRGALAEKLFKEVDEHFNSGREKSFYRCNVPGFDKY